MLKWFDESPRLARFLAWFSEFMAKRRGLPMVIGLALFIVGFVAEIIENITPGTALHWIGLLCRNLGILVALIGFVLDEPLGK